MMDAHLSERENRLLVELLEAELANVRSQVYHAESHDVKVLLAEREDLVRQLLGRFRASNSEQHAA